MQAHIIGDLHGFYPQYIALLQNNHLVDENLDWIAGDDQLWLIGDMFDRGTQSLECLALTMKLQEQAKACDGVVQCLLGNHELMFLAVHKFKNSAHRESIRKQWLYWGGHEPDIELVTQNQIDWLSQLPAMALVGDHLLIHGDNLSYVSYGMNISQVNDYFKSLLSNNNIKTWIQVLTEYSARRAFHLDLSGPKQASQLLKMYGGQVLAHGHTPISLTTNIKAKEISGPRFYAKKCCNVDAGIYLGCAGFVYSFSLHFVPHTENP